jgi:hypothetical protein
VSWIAAADPRVTALLVALGIVPAKTRRVTIDFTVTDIVVTVTEQYATAEDVEALTDLVKQFRLVPRRHRVQVEGK